MKNGKTTFIIPSTDELDNAREKMYQEGIAKYYGESDNIRKSMVRLFFDIGVEVEIPGMDELGKLHTYKKQAPQTYKQSKMCFENAAILGNSKAMCMLGIMYYYGIGTLPSYNNAIVYFETASKIGNSEAMCILGAIYYYGPGKDHKKAQEYFARAVEKEEGNAMYLLANMYRYKEAELSENDIRNKINHNAKALELYKAARIKNILEANNTLEQLLKSKLNPLELIREKK